MFHRLFAAVLILLLAAGAAYSQECIDYQPNEVLITDTIGVSGIYAYDLAIEGDVAFVTTATRLHAVNITDPNNLSIISSLIGYHGTSIAVQNGLACLASQNDDLYFIDVSDPADMVHVKTIEFLDGLQEVTAHGDFFYAGANHLGVYTIDATDPTDPVLVSSVNVDERVVTLAARDDLLYTVGYDSELCVFSLADPATPNLLGITNSNYTRGGQDIALNGDHLYLAASFQGVKVVDVSNPSVPFNFLGSVGGPNRIYTVAMSGGMLFGGNDPTLQSFDLTAPSVPLLVGRMVSSLECWSMEPYGHYLIGVASDAVVFSLDISQPVSTLPLANHSTGGDARNITFDGFYGFVANGDDGLFIRSAASAGEVSVTPLPGFLHSVTIDGDLAYLPMDDMGLQIADVSDVSNPVLLDDINTSGHARDVAVYHNASGTYALVADTEYDLASYDATDPTWIRPKGITYFPGQVYDIEVYGDYALVADNTGALHVVDVSLFPDPLQVVASLEVPGAPIDLLVVDDVVFVSGGNYMNTVDLGNPLAPQLLDSLETSWAVLDVAVKDGVAYVSRSGFGMDIVDVSDPAAMQPMSDFETLSDPAGLDVYEDRVFLCKGDEGITILPLQCLLSPVGDHLPGATAGILGQAYPNPFNPRTTISYELPRAAAVDLRIYDLAGRLVRTLVGGDIKVAGRHTVQWDGLDNAGGAVPSGVYLYRMNAAGHQESRRMVLLR